MRTRGRTRRIVAVVGVIALVVVAACSGDDPADTDGAAPVGHGGTAPAADEATYVATIDRGAHGIAHITADDWGSLGFGQGWALAEDHACTLADQIVKVRGERARWFGPGDDDAHVRSDVAYRALRLYEAADELWPELDPVAAEVIEGFAEGYNAWLDDTGVDDVPGWCAGEPWVEPITAIDLLAYYKDLALLASGRNLIGPLADAAPPGSEALVSTGPRVVTEDPIDDGEDAAPGSNGWAIGGEGTGTDRGILVANPHFPWEGELRLWEQHLRIPGELDVYGASLIGVPAVLIGFNEHVAWTHTVSAGNRFTLYRLSLVPGDPTSYFYGDEVRAMTSQTVQVDVLTDDGDFDVVEHTVWSSHQGPIVDLPGIGWTDSTAVALRDANADNDGFVSQFLGMNRAASLEEFAAVHRDVTATLWVNTIAVDADGTAWYVDAASTPNLSPEAIEAYRVSLVEDPIVALAAEQNAVLLDGSDPLFEWVDAPGAAAAGLVPFDAMPQLERDDYVLNANDSHWLTHPDAPLEGFSPLHGPERTARSPRTRENLVVLDELVGPDGPDELSLDDVKAAVFANRSFTAAELLDDVVERCREAGTVEVGEGRGADGELVWEAGEVDLREACDVLDRWDRHYDLESRGALLWREFLARFDTTDQRLAGNLWSDPFDPTDPVATPSGLAPPLDGGVDQVAVHLGEAVRVIEAAGFALDAPWSEVQWTRRGDERIPIHGAGSWEGVTNVVGYGGQTTSLEPGLVRGPRVEASSALTEEGYPVNSGASFVMVVEFTDDGPRAEALLTYGQSGDPESPYYADQTYRFSDKAWRAVRFTQADIDADDQRTTTVVSGPRRA